MDTSPSLEKILFPYDIALFYREYFEKKPLLIQRNNEAYFSGILDIENVNEYLEKKDIRYPALRLVKEGFELPQNAYLKDVPFGSQVFDKLVDNDKMFYHFAEGCSIVLQAFHRTFIPLTRFVQHLEKYFNFPLQTNIYLTPASARGFNAHFDNHDVFLLQVYGSKIWKVYDSPVYLPTKPFDKKKWVATAPIIDVELKAGDTLYMPRGYVHEGLTTNSASMHITLGLLTYKWIDMLRLLLAGADEIKQCRETLPLAEIGSDEFREKLAGVFGEILHKTDFENIRHNASERFMKKSMSADDNRLFDILAIDTINNKTILHKRREINCRHIIESDSCVLIFYDKKISFPRYAEDALNYILMNDNFRIEDIITNLDTQGKTILIKSLVKEGFLTMQKNE